MKKQSKAEELIKAYRNKESIKFDPNGSYTGITKEKYEKPIQDADDL